MSTFEPRGLVDRWLSPGPVVEILDEASVASARQSVRAEAAAIGLSSPASEAAVTAASELTRNLLQHASMPRLFTVRPIVRAGVPGLELMSIDGGPGISDPTQALAGHASTRGTLGIGLAGTRDLMDELDFDVRLGAGTAIWARKFASPVARRREVGILGRPYPGETVSGDDSWFARGDEGSLLLAVADGLGHGPLAALASGPAMTTVKQRWSEPLLDIFAAVDRELHGTRGAVMQLLRLDEGTSQLSTVGVGDTRSYVVDVREARPLPSVPGTLGSKAQGRTRRVERTSVQAHELLLLATDGLSSKASIPPALWAKHPIEIAHQLLLRFGRDNDDVTILVAR